MHVFLTVEGSAANACSQWCSVPTPFLLPPPIPDGFVVRPEFRCGPMSYVGAHGFVVDPGSGAAPFFLTALHVLDELIKDKGVDCFLKNQSYTGTELPQLISTVNLYHVFADKWMFAECGTAGPMLVLPEARMGEEEPYSQRDLAAFVVSSAPALKAQVLAPNIPSVGDPIWLAAKAGQAASNRTVAAVIVEFTETTLIFRFLDRGIVPSRTSGAPLVNRHGEVVGIHCGHGVFDGHHFGHGPHIASIRRHLGVWLSSHRT